MITDKELLYLQEDSSLTYTEVSMRIAENRPTTNLHRPLPHVTRDQPLSLEGFWDILNTNKWADTLQWLEEKFDPRTLLQRKPNTTAPLGTARAAFLDALKAATNLLAQFRLLDSDGNLQPNPKYDQMTMLLRCMPLLLLRRGPTYQNFTQLVHRRIGHFMRGEWRILYESTSKEQQMQNEMDANRTGAPKPNISRKQERALEQARNLNYSRAMNILRSSGPPSESPDDLYRKLQQLHPPEESQPVPQPEINVPMSEYSFITGKWVAKQIRRAKRGTAVDQWGWDSKEMWRDILNDAQFLEEVATHWILPVAAGYLPIKYRDHLAGGRLVAISKAPKPGIRPINVTDVWRRIAAKGLLTNCLPELAKYFQTQHKRVFQFATATPNGASNMFHVLHGIYTSIISTQPNEQDPTIMVPLDLHNAFNMESRQHILQHFANACPIVLNNENSKAWHGWDILWKHIQAHYGVTGNLKFYHSGKTYSIQSQTGTQQGDPLGTVLFSAPVQPLLHKIADTYSSILILAFADNVCLMGPSSQVLPGVDAFATTMDTIHLRLNPAESLIFIPNPTPSQRNCATLQTPMGLILPCTSEGIKILGAPIGNQHFEEEQFKIFATKIEDDLALLQQFPYLHQRTKLLTFCTNTRPHYFLGTVSPRTSTAIVHQLDKSVDNLWAHTLLFPQDYAQSSTAQHYLQALRQYRLGIREGGTGCFRLSDIIHSAYFSALADTIYWLKEHPIDLPWLQIPLTDTLRTLLTPTMVNLQQQTELQIATECPPTTIQRKQDLPLRIPSPSCIPDWPQHLFPRQGDFARHIKRQQHERFRTSLSSEQAAKFNAIGRHTVTLHKRSHLLTDRTPRTQLWQCSTSLFSLTCFYELSNQAFINSTCLLFGIPLPHAIYLKTTQPTYAQCDIWGDALLNKSTHAAETRKTTHTLLAQELTKIANECGVPTTCNESRLPYRDEGTQNCSRKRADMMTLCNCGITANPILNFHRTTHLVMDVTIGHTYSLQHDFKANTLREMESGKCRKYQRFYQRQRLAFAPMVTNSLGQCGPDLLQFLWNLADHYAQTMFGFSLDENTTQSSTPSTQQAANYRKLRGQKYNENRQRILTCIFEGITTRLYGITFNLTCSPQYTKWFEQLRHNWSPIIPKFDLDLGSSLRTSQPSQFSNSMRSPFTDVASTQSSELAQPSYFSNPALMEDNNLQSLNVDTNSLPTPTRGRRRRREPSPSPPLSPTSSTPHQRPRTHTYASHFLSTLTIAPSP